MDFDNNTTIKRLYCAVVVLTDFPWEIWSIDQDFQWQLYVFPTSRILNEDKRVVFVQAFEN